MERAFGFTQNVPPTGTGEIAPGATVRVRNAGTITDSTIFSDDGVTPKANPFTSDATTGYWFFYAASTVDYDVTISGTGITSYTLGDISLGGVFSLNGLTTNPQVFATATTGTDFTITSTGSTHTFAIPDASAIARGLITTGDQQIAGAKTFGTPIALTSGGTGLSAAPTNGQLFIGNTAGPNTVLLGTLTATADQTTVTNGAGSITIGTVQNIGATSSPTFLELTVSGLSGLSLVGTNGSSALRSITLTDGQLAIGGTGIAPVAATLTAGANVTITNASGSITIASAGAIASLNGLTAATQTFVTGTSALAGDFFIDSVGSTHTFNLPNADTGVRGAVSTTAQSIDGVKTFNDPPLFYPGTQSTNSAAVPGFIYANNTAVTTVTTAEEPLFTFLMKAGTLNATAKGVRITCYGTTSTDNQVMTVRVYFGLTAPQINLAAVNQAREWFSVFTVMRVDDTHQNGFALDGYDNSGHTGYVRPNTVTPVEDLTTDITIKVTGEAAVSGTVTGYSMTVETIGK